MQTQDEVMAKKWANRRKWIIGGVLVLAFLWVLGAYGQNSTGRSSNGEPIAAQTVAAEPITVSGLGQSIADVELVSGLARFAMKHEGSGHFSVELLTKDGERATGANAASDTLLANTSGAPWEGQKAVRIEKAGPFVLDISANGPWQVTITY